MMEDYIINSHPQHNGDFEIHKLHACDHLPVEQNRLYLGQFANCYDAIRFAKELYPNVAERIDGCYYCCNSCHTH